MLLGIERGDRLVVPSGGELGEVAGGADDCPLCFDLVDAAEEELAEIPGLLTN